MTGIPCYNTNCLDGINGGVFFYATDHNLIDCGRSALCETINVLLHLGNGGNSHGGRFVMLTEIERAYWAGFVDGDGCITISVYNRKKRRFRLCVTITQADENILKEGQSSTNLGSVYVQRRTKMRHPRDRYYAWQTDGAEAELLLEMLVPYLRVKRKQAQLALEYRKFKAVAHEQGTHDSETTRDVFGRYAEAIKALKNVRRSSSIVVDVPKEYTTQLPLGILDI